MSAQTETTGKKVGWGVANIIVLFYAFIPVIWIISLSLKGDDTLNDGNFIATKPTSEAYSNLIRGLNLGIGSTMAVLIFITTGIIAFVFIKAFGAAAPGADPGGRK